MGNETPKSAWVPSGVDPTDLDYQMQGTTPRGCLGKIWQFGIVLLALYGLLAMYQASSTTARGDPSPAPTDTIITTTPAPTWTPGVQIITATPGPTSTVAPTATMPGAVATWTPGPWMLERFYATHEAIMRRSP